MATRQERLLERMRGARMHEVADASFGFELPAPEPIEPEDEAEPEADAEPAPPSRPTPNTSAKRTRPPRSAAAANISPNARVTRSSQASPPQSSLVNSGTRAQDVYDLSQSSADGIRARPRRRSSKRVSIIEPDEVVAEDPEPEPEAEPEPEPEPTAPSPAPLLRRTPRRASLARSPLVTGSGSEMAEEVTESPVNAPGSGRRRAVEARAAVGSSVLLQRVLEELDEPGSHPPSSSPSQRAAVARRSSGSGPSPTGLAAQRRSGRLSGGSVASSLGGAHGGEDELTPDRPKKKEAEVRKARYKPDGKKLASVVAPEKAAEEEEPAEEIGDKEAARRLGKRKRPRQSVPAPAASPSPELQSEPSEVQQPAAKRRRRKEVASPARQQQPKAPKPKAQKKQPPGAKKRRKASAAPAEDTDEEGGESVPVTVQRFTKGARAGEDDPAADILNAEIPFAGRSGVNAVDVLSALCEELIDTFLAKLADNVRSAEDAATKREQRTMLRSLEAFQEELRTRLLEHTIALDTLHALRKRVRATQKEKLALRDEILRIRAEREQVALRMDAIRIRHEAESKEAMRHISLSSAMHDIDLIVEKGQAAAADDDDDDERVSPDERREEAELAGLELLVARIAEQASSKSDGGGALKQIKDFNAFLERAAGVLERR
ncbi:hypothetical protein QBC47DRAFT_461024 [Echria macrotheca]|uniref:Inner kinetochore subunit AME1 domain-containing protein n=1 Tax=Echria macrotheca TaxID=438768 RepID=A0AAJ0BAY9_9PEZI|nr:hypothetical protein QBC47DRAFT_461024 [Echria macrotheca]